MKKTKIIQFIYGMNDGGAETLVKDYCLLLDKERFEVVLLNIAPTDGTANWRIIQNSGVRVITIYPWWFLQRWNIPGRAFNKLFKKWYIPWKLKQIFAREKPDVIHVHMVVLHHLQSIFQWLKKVRLFYTCHSLPCRYFAPAHPEEDIAARCLIKHNNLRLIGLHDDMAQELNQMFGVKNSLFIRNGVDFRRYKNLTTTKSEEREKLGILQNAFVLGHVGRFSDEKNHNFLVDVFSEVVRQKPEAYLLMIGAGPNMSKIVTKLNSLGLQGKYQILSHRSDVNEIMKAMDVFVFPSKFEGLGIVAVEAQASGLRCVMSDQVPKSAFLTETAVALPLGNAKQWADVILNPNIKGHAYGNLDDWDMNKEIKKLEALYRGEL